MLVNFSCDDFLDAYPNDSVPENKFWQSESDLTKFVTDIYASTFPVDNEGAIFLMKLYLIIPIWFGMAGIQM